MDQESQRRFSIYNVPGEIACLLSDLCRRWVSGTPSKMHSPHAKLNEEKNVEGLKAYCLDGEEIATEHLASVMPKEDAPGAAVLSAPG